MLFLVMVVVPVSSLAGGCPLVTVCCVRKEKLFHSIPLSHCQKGFSSHFEFSKPAITIGPRNRLKDAVEENMTLRMTLIFERPRTAHFSVLFLFA